MSPAKWVSVKVLTIARATLAAALLIAGLSVAAPAQATLLGLTPPTSPGGSTPDMTVVLLETIVRTPGTDSNLIGADSTAGLSTNGFSLASLNKVPLTQPFWNFSLVFNSSEKTFSITDFFNPLTILLAGNLTAAGDSGVGATETYDFRAQLTTLDTADGFGPWVGIILEPFTGTADIFNVAAPVPEPGTLLLLGAGLLGLAAVRRRKA